MRSVPLALFASFLCTGLVACASTQGPASVSTSAISETKASAFSVPQPAPALEAFAPRPTNGTQIDYAIWDAALQGMVFRMGQSLRTRPATNGSLVGSRMNEGHDSRYRLEGNKLTFSQLDDDYIQALRDYADDLERIANEIDIPALGRNEQLAFWLNLHNAEMIARIGEHYPIKEPSQILIDDTGLALNEAPVFTIDGVDLSLRDVRERIVYAHWNDPVVMYGFWRGTIGGPSIQARAYTADNAGDLLRAGAREFVNSLRGVNDGRDAIAVSAIYFEAAPYFFPDFETDLRYHLATYARDEVRALLNEYPRIEMDAYEERIADLAGGSTRSSASQIVNASGRQVGVGDIPETAQRLLREFEDKVETARRRGMLRGTVTIIDEPTEDPDREVE